MLRSHRQESYRIAEPPGCRLCPIAELLPRPLETVIGMAELAGGKRLPHYVVLAIRRRQHHRTRLGELEQHALEGRQPRRVEMFDDLDNSGGVEAFEPFVSIH